MIFTTTSLAFIILGIGSGIFCLMFRRAFRKQQDSGVGEGRVGKLISSYFLIFAVSSGVILGLGTLFFGGSPTGLFSILIAFALGLTALSMLGLYIIHYVFFPQSSKAMLLGFALLLGAITVATLIATHPVPFVENRSIVWNVPFKSSVPFLYLLFIGAGSGGYIFLRLFRRARTLDMKILSLVLGLAGVLGALVPPAMQAFAHLASGAFPNYAIDIFLGTLGASLILCFLALFFLRNRKLTPLISIISVIYFITSVFWVAFILLSGHAATYEGPIFEYLLKPFLIGIMLLSLAGGFFGLLRSRESGGWQGGIGKGMIILSLGFLSWGLAMVIWNYYLFFFMWEVPYPSLADIFFALAVILWIYGILRLGKATGVKFSLKSIWAKLTVIVVPLAILCISYYLLFIIARGGVLDLNRSFLQIFIEFLVSLLDVMLLTTASLVFIFTLLSHATFDRRYKGALFLLLFCFASNYIADFIFFFVNVGKNPAYFNGHIVDYLYTTLLFLGPMGVLLIDPRGIQGRTSHR